MSRNTDALNRAKRNHRLGFTASREEVTVLLVEIARLEQEVSSLRMKFENANGSRLFQQKRADDAENAANKPDHVYRPVQTIEGVVCSYCKGPATSPRHYMEGIDDRT